MWLLGAGASATAGVPTAYHMIWEFKRAIYCSDHRLPIKVCEDLSDQTLRNRLQAYFDGKGSFPACDSAEEYAYFFEAAYPSDADRRRYIDEKIKEASPSFGHKVLATLIGIGKANVAWTTNFDRLIEDAYSMMHGSNSRLIAVNLENPGMAHEALTENRLPLYVKLHGDFQSRRLKNSPDELRGQNRDLSMALVNSCRQNGLVVVGYSGRDDSIMDALHEGLHAGHGFPMGLYWCQRSDSPCLPRVQQLIDEARVLGIDAHILPIETFDELLGDIVNEIPDVPAPLMGRLNEHPRYFSSAEISGKEGSGCPVIRLNALSVNSYPHICRKVVCDIGGYAAVQQAIADSGAELIATRSKHGVLCFGSDDQIQKAFGGHSITEIDVFSIAAYRLGYEDSHEKGLLYDALCRALVRDRPLIMTKRRYGCVIAVDPARFRDDLFLPLRQTIPAITGTVPNTNVQWSEGVTVRLEFRFDALWLLLEPKIWVDIPKGQEIDENTKEFIRARTATRYNVHVAKLLDAWVNIIVGDTATAVLSAFPIPVGIDPTFTIEGKFAFSRKG